MTENDVKLIEMARYMRDDEEIEALIKKADTEEAKAKLQYLADEAFRIRQRIAFEYYE